MGKWVGWKIRKYLEGNIKQFIDEQGHVQKQSSLRSNKVKELSAKWRKTMAGTRKNGTLRDTSLRLLSFWIQTWYSDNPCKSIKKNCPTSKIFLSWQINANSVYTSWKDAQEFEGHMSLNKGIRRCFASLPLHLRIEAILLSDSGISWCPAKSKTTVRRVSIKKGWVSWLKIQSQTRQRKWQRWQTLLIKIKGREKASTGFTKHVRFILAP